MILTLLGDTSQEDAPKEEDNSQGGGLFRALARGLTKTRRNLNEGFERLVGAHAKLDEAFMEELEEVLFSADIGPEITMRIVGDLRTEVKKNLLKDAGQVVEFVKKELAAILTVDTPPEPENPEIPKPFVVLVIGVNGSGKTTTIGKLSSKLAKNNKKVMLAAADTFRAAAIGQLETWAERAGTEFIRQQEGSDPAAVVFDAAQAARKRDVDVLIADTAGRLQSKVNLMEELKKVHRVLAREIPGAPHETILVLDATTGQNAISQAKIFHEAVGVDGIILTKLDGTAKGGVVISITETLKIPVKLIGVGEKIDDLRPFHPSQFVEAIFSGADMGAEKDGGQEG